jgi:iron complex transport system substrate-binding protein
MNLPPGRIVCLSAEAADWMWRLGAWEAVVGVTAHFVSPAGAAPKPVISGFSSANVERILGLQPDLVFAFSEVQAGIAAQLISHGCTVLTTNPRSLQDIEQTLALQARCVNRMAAAEPLLREFRERLAPVAAPARRPRVYFEEWDRPLITGIAWVSELIERAGGEDIFADRASRGRAPDRVIQPEQVLERRPEIIVASWCGRPISPAAIAARPGWNELPAIRTGRVHELAGEHILQPGMGLIHGFEKIKGWIQAGTV